MNKETKKKTGRPPLSEKEKTVGRRITIIESQLAHLEQVGGGNVSNGARIVIDAHMKRYWPINKICPGCEFFIDGICTDPMDYIHSQTGNAVCRYNPFAVLRKEHNSE